MNILAQVLLPLILAFMMFSMGIDLTIKDFKNVVKFPKPFLTGILLQFVSLPILALVIATVSINLGLKPIYALGIMILAVCPGGVTSNILTHLAKGDSALSVSLTSISSIATIFTLPILVSLSKAHFINDNSVVDISVEKMTLGVFFITTVPIILGMTFKFYKEKLAKEIEPKLRKVSGVLFILIVIGAIVKDINLIKDNFIEIAPAVFALNIVTMLLSYLTASTLEFPKKQITAIVYECGLQNSTLTIFIGLTLLKNDAVVLPAVVYSISMYLLAFAYYKLVSVKTSKELLVS
ncbi:MAG: bile acid:sodium symporter [Halobacteriovorax sp.]|nr:bile acid:sodium symporter [Halobacteriovorax sp.]